MSRSGKELVSRTSDQSRGCKEESRTVVVVGIATPDDEFDEDELRVDVVLAVVEVCMCWLAGELEM